MPAATATVNPPPSSRNPWPYALIGVFAVFISFVAWSVTMASRQRVDLVRPDYYDQEIRFQQQIDRVARTAQPGVDVTLALAPGGKEINLSIPSRHAVDFAGGTVSLYRPSDASRDREIALKPSPEGKQVVSVAGLEAGLWKVRVNWKSGGAEYFHEQSVTLPGGR